MPLFASARAGFGDNARVGTNKATPPAKSRTVTCATHPEDRMRVATRK
jgi:hypothetical protein